MIDNNQDIIDSRDIIARIEELEEMENNKDEEMSNDEKEELDILRKINEECKSYPNWEFGEILIRDSYFEEYTQDFALDIGAISDDTSWPSNCIDWEQAARELQMDYGLIDFDGVEYWIRE